MIGNIGTTYTQPFAGYIDDFRIYNRILSAAEIAALAARTPFQPALPLATGLTHYYPFDGALTNSGTSGGSLTATGSVSYHGGIVGSQCIYLANEANVTAGTAAANYLTGTYTFPTTFTVSVWANSTRYPTTANWTMLFFTSTTVATNNMYFGMNGISGAYNILGGFVNGSSTASSPAVINTWYNITITYNTGTLTLYVNGANIGTCSGTLVQSNFMIGNSGTTNTQPFAGYIDDFRIYNSVLTPSQIAALYYNTNTPYTNFQQAIDGDALADFQWGTANAKAGMLSTWIKNNTATAQSYTLALNSTGLIAHLPLDNSYADAVGANVLSAPRRFGTAAFTASTFKVGSYALDLTGNTAGGTAAGLVSYVYSYAALPLSISVWLYPTAAANWCIPVSIGSTTANNYAVNITINASSQVYSEAYISGIYYLSPMSSPVTLSQWMHVTCTIAPGNNMILYINGVVVGYTTLPSTAITLTCGTTTIPSSLLTLGCWALNSSTIAYKGYIDDLRIYNRALTQAQVAALYAANQSSTTAPTSTAVTLPVRSLLYNTPSIAASSWQQVQMPIPADTTGVWETRAGYPGANLALSLGAGPSWSNVTTGTWNTNMDYNGGSNTQLINYSANNFLAASSNAVLMTSVQLEKGNIATPIEYRPAALETTMASSRAGSVINTWNAYLGSLDVTPSTDYILLSLTVTPLSPTSRFLINASVSVERLNGATFNHVIGYLRRNTKAITPTTYYDGAFINALGQGVAITVRQSASITYLDTPNAVSPIVYDIYIDRSQAPNIRFIWYAACVTIQEIAQ